jgi:hypothetical protein
MKIQKEMREYLPIEMGAGAGKGDGGVGIKAMDMTNKTSLRHAKALIEAQLALGGISGDL